MRRIFLMFTALCIVFASCENKNIDNVYKNGLKAIYPHAKYIDWDEDDGYMTASFRDDKMDVKVWFDDDGNWLQIKTDMTFKKVPQIIKNAFNSSEYADWKIEDIDYLQIKETPYSEETVSFYEFEVEKKERDREFIIYPDGVIADKPDIYKL